MDEREALDAAWRCRLRDFEVAREQGRTVYALEGLRAIRSEAAEKSALEIVALATAHILICYKHLFENTGKQSFLSAMESELKQALLLPSSSDIKAAFLLRYSDLECMRGNPQMAESFCQQAHPLTHQNSQGEAECLRRWAHCKTLLGQLIEAEHLLNRSAQFISKLGGARTFERVSLECGLLANKAKLAFAQRRYAAAIANFLHGYICAWEYRLRYGMPHRVKQYHHGFIQAVTASFRCARNSN